MTQIKDIIDVLFNLDELLLDSSEGRTKKFEHLLIECKKITLDSKCLFRSSKIRLMLNVNCFQNSRFELAVCVAELLELLNNEKQDVSEAVCGKENFLMNLKLLKAMKNGIRYIFYTSVFDCLENDAASYYNLTAAKNNWKLSNATISDLHFKFQTLQRTMKLLIHLLELEGYGEELWKTFSLEYICALLQLSFSPSSIEEKSLFRDELVKLMDRYDNAFFLQQLLMLRSTISSKKTSWFKSYCTSIIIRHYIMKPNGVKLVVQIGLQNDHSPDWKKKEAIARIVTLGNIKNMNIFYESIGKQVVDLANETFGNLEANKEKELNINILHITGFIIEQLIEKNKELSELYIYEMLLAPLISTTERSETSDISNSSNCVGLLHKLYVETMSPNSRLCSLIEPVLCPLMKLAIMDSITHIKSLSLQIIIRYLSQLSNEETVIVLNVLSELENRSHFPRVRYEISFEFADDIVRSCPSGERDLLAEDDRLVKCIVKILEKLQNSRVTRSFFENISKYLNFATTRKMNWLPTSNQCLLTEADKIEVEFLFFRTLTKVAGLLSYIADHEKLIDNLFSDLEASCQFLNSILKAALQKTTDKKIIAIQESLSLNIAMLLFSYLGERVSSKIATKNDWHSLNLLLPVLKSMKSSTSNGALRKILTDLMHLILTHGSNGLKMSTKAASNNRSKFRETIDDLSAPHIPIKGHGIIALTDLIRKKDAETIEKIDTVILLFKHHLTNEDTYIYLAAIEGLATICDLCPDEVIPLLTKEFTEKQKLSTETRIKMIEILTKATVRLGEFLPKYRNYFLNSLLFGCRDKDDLIRASSLSNLGEVCRHLHFSLGPIVHEVLLTVHDAITCDKSISVRRAGVLVLTFILRGLEKSVLKVLDDVLLQIYRFLKTLQRDTDDIIRLHTAIALQEIDEIAKTLLKPQLNMTEKKIYVTQLPTATLNM